MVKRSTKPKAKALEADKVAFTPTGRKRTALNPAYAITRQMSSPANVLQPNSIRTHQFGQLLRAAMRNKGIKQIQLAAITEIKRDSISGYVTGRVMPSTERLERIAKALDVQPDDLCPDYKEKAAGKIPVFFTQQAANGKDIWVTINRAIPIKLFAELVELMAKVDGEMSKHPKSKG